MADLMDMVLEERRQLEGPEKDSGTDSCGRREPAWHAV